MNEDLMLKKIKEALEESIKFEADELFERKKQEMIEELDKKKDEIVTGIAIRIMQTVQMERFGNILRIEVSTEKIK